jgi:2-polyprenyl-6-methoxyphenol hydroxylase-like FAD-dependent oxidoreductase
VPCGAARRAQSAKEKTFTLRMRTEMTGLIREGGRVAGIRYKTAEGAEGELRADLVVAADAAGRSPGGKPAWIPRSMTVGSTSGGSAYRATTAAAGTTASPWPADPNRPGEIRSRRLLPTMLVQGLQRILHRAVMRPVMAGKRDGPRPPRRVLETASTCYTVSNRTGRQRRHRGCAR